MLPILHRSQFLARSSIFLAQTFDIRLIVLKISCVTLLDLLIAVDILGADGALAVVPVKYNELVLTADRASRVQPSLQRDDSIASAILLELALIVVGDEVLQALRQATRLVTVN